MEMVDFDELPDPGVTRQPCNNDPLLRHLNAEKCVIAAASKGELDRVLDETRLDGWTVVIRGHDSETGRHQAKMLRAHRTRQRG